MIQSSNGFLPFQSGHSGFSANSMQENLLNNKLMSNNNLGINQEFSSMNLDRRRHNVVPTNIPNNIGSRYHINSQNSMGTLFSAGEIENGIAIPKEKEFTDHFSGVSSPLIHSHNNYMKNSSFSTISPLNSMTLSSSYSNFNIPSAQTHPSGQPDLGFNLRLLENDDIHQSIGYPSLSLPGSVRNANNDQELLSKSNQSLSHDEQHWFT